MSDLKDQRNGRQQDTDRSTPFIKWVQATYIKLKDHHLTARVLLRTRLGILTCFD